MVRRDPRSIAFVGRFSPEKSPMLFLQALAILRQRGIEFRASMLGTGPMLGAMQSRITEEGLSSWVTVGFRPDVSATVLEAAVFVSLQTGDNYPSQSLLEAMGAGCAVVASDVGETWRLVDSAVGCRVPLDPVKIADALGALLDSPTATRRLGEEALKRVRTGHTEENYASFLEELYERALELHKSRQRS
ncbi:MAG: glycosyltransferase family 4 protein [Phycisphaerales bacterium]